jgi:phage tail sheath gpL-like
MPVEASAVARVLGIDAQFRDLRGGAAQFLPQHIGIVGQGQTDAVYPLTPYRITSATQAAARYGFGSPIHLAALQLFPPTGGGVGSIPVTVYPLVEDGEGVAASGSITPPGEVDDTASYWVRIAGILSAPFIVEAGDSPTAISQNMSQAINGVLEMPCGSSPSSPPGSLELTAKWAGDSGNDIVVEVLTSTGAPATTFTVVQPTGGLNDPDISPALARLGNTWVTMIINALGPDNTAALDALSQVGEGRWGQLVRRPFVAFRGSAETGPTVPSEGTRTTDRVNCQLVAPGSVNLPVQIAAAQVREIAKVANDNPPTDYGSRAVRGLLPGADGEQWDYTVRDAAVKAGCSTVELKNGLVTISDVVTMYRPAGEVPPAYRYVVDIVKLMNIIYNLDLEFSNPQWDGAPLIPDGQATVNPNARKPSTAKAAVCRILDSLALEAIISDPKTAKANTFSSINSQNPKRLDVQTTVQLSGNSNIISVDLFFGFYFGAPTLVG